MTKHHVPRTIALTIAAALSSGWALAQSPAPAAARSPTNLKDAVERAILHNPEVKLRFHNLQAAQHDKSAGDGAWQPRIDLEAATGANQLSNPSLSSALNYQSNRATLQLRQTLFDGFASLHESRRLSYAQQAAYFELVSSSNQTGLEAARAYIDVLRYRELIRLAGENYATHQEVHDRISQKVTAGVGRRVDLEQAAGRMALAESNWLTEASNFHDVSARYQRLVGDTPAEALAPLGPLDEFLPIGTEFLTDATKRNPDFLAAVANIRAYRADGAVRRAAMYPTLELRARQSFETNRDGASGDYPSSALEVVLSYNLYRGGSDSSRVKQYAAKLDAAFDLRDKACRDVWQTGQIAFNDSIRLVAQLKLLSQHELSTSKAKQAYQQQFEIGQRSLLDLLDTENELYQARRSLINGEHDLNLAEVRVRATSGSLLGALKLKPLADNMPDASGDAEEDDGLLACNNRILPSLTLDRTFDSRPAGLISSSNPPVLTAASGAVAAPAPASLSAPATATPSVAAVVPAVAAVATGAAALAAIASKASDDACAELPKAVNLWLEAWNRKDVTQYLGAYATNFVPANGMDRKTWEALRRARIGKQGAIQVTIGQVVPTKCDATAADVTFPQEYGSASYKDKVEKTLSLERVQGVWKISREKVTKGRAY
jgi:adhesin transport system outer membrane protein